MDWANIIFLVIFSLEFFFKILGFGWKVYFYDSSNSFDFAVLAISFIELAISSFNFEIPGLLAIRTLRLLRVFKLAKVWSGL
jgi:hypothetical protein